MPPSSQSTGQARREISAGGKIIPEYCFQPQGRLLKPLRTHPEDTPPQGWHQPNVTLLHFISLPLFKSPCHELKVANEKMSLTMTAPLSLGRGGEQHVLVITFFCNISSSTTYLFTQNSCFCFIFHFFPLTYSPFLSQAFSEDVSQH